MKKEDKKSIIMIRKFITVMFPYPSGAGLHLGH